jgi:hypothetical protein
MVQHFRQITGLRTMQYNKYNHNNHCRRHDHAQAVDCRQWMRLWMNASVATAQMAHFTMASTARKPVSLTL